MSKVHKSIVAQIAGSFETAELQGKNYIVLPVVAMIEGVRFGANAGGSGELGLAAEFGKFPAGWNNRPVVLGHPRVNNQFVSAGDSPQVLEEHAFGFTMGTVLDGKSLKMEAWLDTGLRDNEAFKDVFERIDAGDVIEVSVGFFTEVEERSGQFKGQEYAAIWRNLVPDHLAFLEAGTIGACSIEDGCGTPRVNGLYLLEAELQNKHISKDRKKKKKRLVEDEEDEEDAEDTTNTTAQGAGCRCTTPGTCSCSPHEVILSSMENLGFKINAKKQVVLSAQNAQVIQHLVAQLVPEGILDTDVRNALNAAISEIYDFAFLIGFTNTVCVYDIFDSNRGTFVTVQQTFTMDNDGNITFTSDPEEVRLLTRIVPITTGGGDNINVNLTEDSEMSKEKLKTQDTADDKAVKGTTETHSDKPEVAVNTAVSAVDSASKLVSVPEVQKKAVTVQEYIDNAPSELKDALQTMHSTHGALKQEIIAVLKDTGRCEFTDAFLNSQSLTTLEQLRSLANVADFSGRTTPISRTQETANGYVEAPKVFEAFKKKAI